MEDNWMSTDDSTEIPTLEPTQEPTDGPTELPTANPTRQRFQNSESLGCRKSVSWIDFIHSKTLSWTRWSLYPSTVVLTTVIAMLVRHKGLNIFSLIFIFLYSCSSGSMTISSNYPSIPPSNTLGAMVLNQDLKLGFNLSLLLKKQ